MATINIKKWYHAVILSLPLWTAMCIAIGWVEFRYMHKKIADTRYIDLQITIIEGHIRDYNRMIDQGIKPSARDETENEQDMIRLSYLEKKRGKMLGLEDLPE